MISPKTELRLDEYMRLSNAYYYAHRNPFGASGDFYTSPELCQAFGELIGLWAYQVWETQIKESVTIVELGPGRGTLLSDFWRATQNYWCPTQIQFSLLESSPSLTQIQQKMLSNLPNCHWTSDIQKTIPSDRPFILIANEFLDALPIRQFHENGTKEIWVKKNEQTWIPFLQEAGDRKSNDHPILECNEEAEALIKFLCAKLKNQKGIVLLIDYGYVENKGGDSLQAIRNHQFVPPFSFPGEADLTAHVNFYALSLLAQKQNCFVHGPILQAAFLNRLGFSERIQFLSQKAKNPHSFLRSARCLVDPTAMGALFKVMAISSFHNELPGFAP